MATETRKRKPRGEVHFADPFDESQRGHTLRLKCDTEKEWIRAVCTLLPSNRGDHIDTHYLWSSLSPAVAHTVTLPRRPGMDPKDHIVINLRRQLSNASHRKVARPKSAKPVRPSRSFRYLTKRTGVDFSQGETEDYVSVPSDAGDDTDSVSGEQDKWQHLLAIPSMPVSMAEKRRIRTRLQQTPVSPATGLSALEFNKQKARRRLNETWKNFTSSIFIWSQSMKTIEGRYGTGVVSYFIFLRWLLLLNIFICILVFSFIVLPQIVNLKDTTTSLSEKSNKTIVDESYLSSNLSISECSEMYRVSVRNSSTIVEGLQDLLQGTGFLEITALFPGFYSDKVLLVDEKLYNISLAYILVTLTYFLVCLIMMVIYTSEGVHEALKTSESQIQKYCNLVFGGWDYCIEEKKTATRKHQSITQELKSTLFEKRRKDQVSKWSRKTKILLFLTRCLVHTVVVAVLGAGGYLIYYVCIKSTEMLNTPDQSDQLVFFLEFLPSITITFLSIFLPIIFNIVTKLENYSISFTIKITLVRTVFVKLASVGVLVWSFYQQLFSCDSDDLNTEMCVPCNKNENKNIKCWETYVGQQIYKLVILDFFVVFVTIFLIDYPRRLVFSKCSCKLAKVVGPLEFDIPKHVLDLVYSQTLCWLGTFYSPLLPAICVLKYIIFFYLKKLTLLVNCSPSQIPYRASRSNTFFMIVLMLSFVSSVIPVGYTIAMFSPSKGCGPFRYYHENMWEPVSVAVESINEPHVKDVINFIASASFAVPLIIILCLFIYYYLTVSSAHKEMINVLKDQLILEGKDKQFLLARLTEDARQRLRTEGSFG